VLHVSSVVGFWQAVPFCVQLVALHVHAPPLADVVHV
jgi:hypothetical protein